MMWLLWSIQAQRAERAPARAVWLRTLLTAALGVAAPAWIGAAEPVVDHFTASPPAVAPGEVATLEVSAQEITLERNRGNAAALRAGPQIAPAEAAAARRTRAAADGSGKE